MKTVMLLIGSNLFMTYAYGHLRTLRSAPLYGQLKITQEIITLAVFVPFSIFYMREQPKLDYLWAALCILGAAYFIFRSR
jgi:uncharacterized protein (DUF486 family)